MGFGRGIWFLGFIQPEQTRGKNFLLFVDWKSSYNEELLILVVVFAYGAGVRATLPTCETCVPLTNYVPLGQLLFCSSVPLLQCVGNIAYFLELFGAFNCVIILMSDCGYSLLYQYSSCELYNMIVCYYH